MRDMGRITYLVTTHPSISSCSMMHVKIFPRPLLICKCVVDAVLLSIAYIKNTLFLQIHKLAKVCQMKGITCAK